MHFGSFLNAARTLLAAGSIACAFLGHSAVCKAAQIYEHFPNKIDPDGRYVIYSHNLIGEGDDPRPVSPQFGIYEFQKIKQAIFEGGGFNLIAYQRKKHVKFELHVKQLDEWVHALLSAGVQPTRISLVGFSRGGQITAYAAGQLSSLGINTAILAICSDGDFDVSPDPPIVIGGNFLSLYETSDQYGSCSKLAARGHLNSFKEVAISTGKAHGAFFEPRPEWITPLKAWIAETNR